MKFLHIIPVIALMIQLSIAASIGRVKRDNNLVNALKDLVVIQKAALPITEIVIKDILTKIPNTLPYSKYIAELEGYLKAIDDYRTIPGPCVDKTIDIIAKYDELVESYKAEDAPAEAKSLAQLFNEDTRLEYLEKELEDWGIKYKITDIDETLNNADYKDVLGIVPIVSEKC